MRPSRWLSIALVLVASACNGKGGGGAAQRGGTLRITIHDAPSDDVDQVWITFDEVAVHSMERGWIVVEDRLRTVDLKALRDGLAQTLTVATLPPGDYKEVRLRVRDSHVVVGGATQPLDVPSGDSSGIKLKAKFAIPRCGEVQLDLDWDLGAHLASHPGGYKLSPSIDVQVYPADEAGCCGDTLCVGGVCNANVCEPGGGEQIVLHEGTEERVRGYFGQDGVSVAFFAEQAGDELSLRISGAGGEALIEVAWEGDQFRTSLFGGGLVTTVDLARLAESQALAELPIGEAPPFSLTGAITTTGDLALADALIARPEYELLPYLSRSLGGAGFNGADYPLTVPIHKIAMQAAIDLEITLPPLPMGARSGVASAPGGCTDLRSDPFDDDCYGMCGPSCSCWEWTCGDCCCHQGCAAHDKTCRNCKWYKPWNCILCYTGLSFLAGLCFSCDRGGGFYEPPCVELGGACASDYDCCGHRNGTDEERAPPNEVVCEVDATGGHCRRDGVPPPAVCGDGACELPESCASCAGDCGTCEAECNANGVCDGYPEDCGTCASDCPCPAGTHCEGRGCVMDGGGGGGAVCGDGACNGGEHCGSCPADCGDCPPGCGDGICLAFFEDCSVCPPDCPCPAGSSCSGGACVAGPTCGDGACNGAEHCGSCPADCGGCPAGCGDGACEPGVEDACNCRVDCPPVCGNGVCDCEEDCTTCPSECGACPGFCGDGSCAPFIEDACNCLVDCPPVCGNGVCDCEEDCTTCPEECGVCPFCGDGFCAFFEDCFSCPLDCGPDPCSP